MTRKKTNRNNVSLAGEFAVLSRLALLGYDANMTLGHTKSVDILVSNPRNKKMYRLEVKTQVHDSAMPSNNSKIFGRYFARWVMGSKHETHDDPLLFYCFVVIMKQTYSTRFFIIPSKVVSRYVRAQYTLLLKHDKKATEFRYLRIGFHGASYPLSTPSDEDYEDKWDYLGKA